MTSFDPTKWLLLIQRIPSLDQTLYGQKYGGGCIFGNTALEMGDAYEQDIFTIAGGFYLIKPLH